MGKRLMLRGAAFELRADPAQGAAPGLTPGQGGRLLLRCVNHSNAPIPLRITAHSSEDAGVATAQPPAAGVPLQTLPSRRFLAARLDIAAGHWLTQGLGHCELAVDLQLGGGGIHDIAQVREPVSVR